MTWKGIALRDIGRWYGGGTPSKSNDAFWRAGSVPWLSPKDMGAATLTATQDLISTAAVVASAVHLVPPVSIAVVVRSGILQRKLPVALVPFETTLNQDMKAVVPHDGIDPRWVAWGLRAFERDLLRAARKAGTTVASIEMSRFFAFELPVPPLEQQMRILALLEDDLSRLDAAERYAKAGATRLRSLAEAAFNSRLAALDIVERPMVDLLEAPLSNGRSVPTRDGGFPVLRLTALKEAGVDLGERKGGDWTRADAARYLVKKGDFLIARGNGSLRLVGRGSLVRHDPEEVAYPDTAIKAKVSSRIMDSEFLDLAWNSRRTRRQLEGMARTSAGIYKLNQKQLEGVRLPVPPLRDQTKLVTELTIVRNLSRSTNQAVERALLQARALRRALLSAAFAGQLTSRSSDDEVIEEVLDAQVGARAAE